MTTVEKTGILLSQSNAFLRKIEYNSHGFTGFLVFLKNFSKQSLSKVVYRCLSENIILCKVR